MLFLTLKESPMLTRVSSLKTQIHSSALLQRQDFQNLGVRRKGQEHTKGQVSGTLLRRQLWKVFQNLLPRLPQHLQDIYNQSRVDKNMPIAWKETS
ncbi:hypothetical protein V1264_024567 [Littorina saxatilis]|uniref:Uncharacterized protein n=1 Tax=Littorina saxatilis TaxID=31220 RepID=A0AAN9AMZ1_9CAEN